MRNCPVCEVEARTEVFRMSYRIPDGWALPGEIVWCACDACGMLYGDGEFNQPMLDQYYRERYGYDLCHPDNIARLRDNAYEIAKLAHDGTVIVDFGGGGEGGKSILIDELNRRGVRDAFCVGAGDPLPYPVDILFASHVLEHVYDLPETMERISGALAPDGLLIIDVPDATGLLQFWQMPILDFNTKHINHFTLRNLLDLANHHGFELVQVKPYVMESAPCYQAHFRRLDVANMSMRHVERNMVARIDRLEALRGISVNVWGMSDIAWHLLANVDLNVLDYIDNDPAYRGQTYNGKPVLERPTNDAPIVIMAQRQRGRLVENIRAAGVQNEIIEI